MKTLSSKRMHALPRQRGKAINISSIRLKTHQGQSCNNERTWASMRLSPTNLHASYRPMVLGVHRRMRYPDSLSSNEASSIDYTRCVSIDICL